jgi:ABC-type transporter Mla subunit MlaD
VPSALAVALAAGIDPFYGNVVTTGGAIIITILTVGLPLVVGQNFVNGRRAKKAVEQTTNTGNGFAAETRQTLSEVRDSLRNVHRRLDAQNDHAARRDDHVDRLLIKIDDRVTHIEEKLP